MRHLLMVFFVLLTTVSAYAEQSDDQLEREAQAVLSQELKADSVTVGSRQPADEQSTVNGSPSVGSQAADDRQPSTESVTVDAKTKESEIPVLTKSKVSSAKSESPFTRIMISLAIVGVIGIGLMIAAKKFGWKKNQESAKTQIKILTQHHLGPKKSLAIIRVAGESILIGVTDHNINLIKPLALLDEEIAEIEGQQNFDAAMDEFEGESEDDFAFGNVQDRVSLRMKQMRKM